MEFFVSDYDSLPISFQSGITLPVVALDKNLEDLFPIASHYSQKG